MQLDPIITGVTAIVILLATFIHGVAGFGAAQVAMGLLPLFRSPDSSSIIFTYVAIVLNLRVLWSVRQEFSWKDWLIPIGGLVIGMPLGIFVFQGLDEIALRIAIGFTLAVGVALIIIMRMTDLGKRWMERRSDSLDKKYGVVAGLLAGILGGSVAIPGPPMILYGTYLLNSEEWTGNQTKAVFTAFFGTLMSYRLVALALIGQITLPLSLEALLVMPALAIGSGLGILVYSRIDEAKFRWLVVVGLAINAALLIFSSIPGL
ncbi:sulfite exporter TauE/SafE family protein [Candidatus Thorarchaeota archaeon]|nr:MAG: sulfite exporter TauE/SafE family protein [Candidatus Thorarchaeota archaeon]